MNVKDKELPTQLKNVVALDREDFIELSKGETIYKTLRGADREGLCKVFYETKLLRVSMLAWLYFDSNIHGSAFVYRIEPVKVIKSREK